MMRKGISIKEMSRSHLEDKCSRWALDRLKEEKRVLVEKIGEASQEIIRLTNLAGEQQAEIRKLSSFNEANSRSGVSVMKNSSLIVDWEGSKR
jgi:autonomous glycyl radical cofactor GrcA